MNEVRKNIAEILSTAKIPRISKKKNSKKQNIIKLTEIACDMKFLYKLPFNYNSTFHFIKSL